MRDMNPSSYFEHHDQTALTFRCPLCDHRYDLIRAQMCNQRDDAQLWHLMCTHCRHAAMFVVVFTDGGINSVGVITDLTSEEVKKFQSQSSISSDDCLVLHEVMEKNPTHILDAIV